MEKGSCSAYDYVTDALKLYGIRWVDTWSGMIVLSVLFSCLEAAANTVPGYCAVLEDVAGDEGIATDTIRRIVMDVMRPMVGDSPTGHRRRLGVTTRYRGVPAALDLVMRYVAVRADQDAGRVDTCRIVAPPSAPPMGAGAAVSPEGDTDVSKEVVG